MTDEERKRKFAEQMLANPGEAYQAALAVFPDDPGHALRIAMEWAASPEIKAMCEQLVKQHGERHFLPTKENIAREVLELGRIADAELRARLAAYRLVAEVLGYIEKPQTNVSVNNTNSYRVMQMPVYASEEDWEQRAIEQQRQLVEDARTKH